MILKKPMQFANQIPLKNSGVLHDVDNNDLVSGMKRIKVNKSKMVRFDIIDITSAIAYNLEYEAYSNIFSVTMNDNDFQENFNFLEFNGYLLHYLDRTQNVVGRTTRVRFGFKGLKSEVLKNAK